MIVFTNPVVCWMGAGIIKGVRSVDLEGRELREREGRFFRDGPRPTKTYSWLGAGKSRRGSVRLELGAGIFSSGFA